ncbi:ligand-effect modulator 3 family [Gilbertella persicaria]|uniref:ligand-effect modulator 3 family n=1 Tax=Gilbertella persicaria TaxID=101096 RepID=UPI00221ECB8A|nr:ligand-effect modulator 3 family [Gilbertella persicaria]KAI8083342.1 ligand-effect modulator 3 family [Gilbertella persicaria]
MKAPVYMYYRLTNFYQNHRQYIKNFDDTQLLGNRASGSTLRTNCDPLAYDDTGKIIYPCGLIANSMFNGNHFVYLRLRNIAWPSDKQKYGRTQYQPSEIVPPPNWAQRYPNGQYTNEYPPPDLSTQERFMVWMHVAALPDFRKIWGRNDTLDLPAGRYRAYVDMNFDTRQYGGEKWLVLSTTTGMGGRNPYLGIAYMSVGALCIFLGLLFTIRHCIKPRKLGDESYLSWNQPGGGLPNDVYVALAVQPYCQPGYKPIGDKDLQLDLSKLNKDFVVFQNETTPPTVTSIMTQINLCDPLNIPDEPENHDICPKGTLICRRTIHVKKNVETVNIVQPIARDMDNKLNAEFKPVRSEDDATKSGYQYSVNLNGGEYNGRAQSALVTLECDESQSRSVSIASEIRRNSKKRAGDRMNQKALSLFHTITMY